MSDQTPQPSTQKQSPSRPPHQPNQPTVTDSDTDPGHRSRSGSRRRRRKIAAATRQKDSKMPPVQEHDPHAETQAGARETKDKGGKDMNGMQPLQRIGSDEASMDGPVTNARAKRGEINPREGKSDQALKTGKGADDGDNDDESLAKQDGLKLRLELNLDVEIELKAKISGDITIALL